MFVFQCKYSYIFFDGQIFLIFLFYLFMNTLIIRSVYMYVLIFLIDFSVKFMKNISDKNYLLA